MKLTREQNKSGYLMGATNVKEVSKCGVEIVTFEKNGMLLSLHWWGKAAKPAKHYRWTTAEKMEAFVQETLLQAELRDANKKLWLPEKKLLEKRAIHIKWVMFFMALGVMTKLT